jgi:ornithine cyclodeaminase
MRIRLLSEAETRRLISPLQAITSCKLAYMRLAQGKVEQPQVITIHVKEHRGDVHAKGGYIHGDARYSIKVATGFYNNPALGLPVTSGAVWVFSATTGMLELMIMDNGYLTELRTGASGAVAAELLARRTTHTVGIIGAGGQARYQLEALLQVRTPERILVVSRNTPRAAEYASEMTARTGHTVEVAASTEALVRASDLIVTTTTAERPLVRDAWVRPGTHITAIGADMPHKQELEASLLGRSKVVVDLVSQCVTQGELHHAVDAGVMTTSDVYAEIGEIAAGWKPGRTSDDEITIADLTGVGVLDAAVANIVADAAERDDVGCWIEV